METSDFQVRGNGDIQSASGLHMVSHMKRVAVAILAMVFVTGCGVGADESYDGQNLVVSQTQGLEVGPEVAPALPTGAGPQAPETTVTSPLRDPGTVALPQDPIPVFEGRPAAQPAPMVDPMMGPAPRPSFR
jgi:hypothetical protein